MKKTWTPEDLDILALNYPTKTTEELLSLLPGKSKQAIHSKAVLLKLRKKEKRFSFCNDDIKLLTDLYPNTPCKVIAEKIGCSIHAVHNLAYRLKIKKNSAYLHEMNTNLGKHLSQLGNKTRFSKGHTPANKGMKQEEYMSVEKIQRTQRTRFQRGHVPGNHKHIGYERIDKNGYLLIKTEEPNIFKLKHRLIWEQQYGPIPKGCNIQFKDGNPRNLSIDNLYLISKSQQLKEENSMYARYPKEVQDLIKLKGALNRQINKITKSD